MKKEFIIILVLVALVSVFVFGKGKAPAPVHRKFKIKAWFGDKTFTVSHPDLGEFKVKNPNDIEGRFNLLKNTPDYNLGWQIVPGKKVVFSLLHTNSAIFSEVYIVDLDKKTVEYYSENQAVVVTA